MRQSIANNLKPFYDNDRATFCINIISLQIKWRHKILVYLQFNYFTETIGLEFENLFCKVAITHITLTQKIQSVVTASFEVMPDSCMYMKILPKSPTQQTFSFALR